MDDIDTDLLMTLQYRLNLTPTPFQQVGEDLGVSEQEVLRRTSRLMQNGTVVRIGTRPAQSASVTTATALVALKVGRASVEGVAKAINGLGGVKHNYLRDCDDYNIWFTIRAGSDEMLKEKIDAVASAPGVLSALCLPTKRVHKLDVRFDLRRGTSWSIPETERRPSPEHTLAPNDSDALRRLAEGIAPVRRPLEPIAGVLGMSEEYIARLVDDSTRRGIIKGVAATLSSEKIGFSENAMVIMRVPPESAAEVCENVVREFLEITHCVERICPRSWPYPCYAMVHGRQRERLSRLADEIAEVANASETRVLFSSKNLRGII